MVPDKIGDYKIIKKLGMGGMGSVYLGKAEDGEQVAVKVISSGTSDQEFIERFKRETRALLKLAHPHVVSIMGFGVEGELVYYTMEYVPGYNLQEKLRALGSLPEKEALEIALHISKALQNAHRHNIVHRDIKPANILLTEDGKAKLTDWGIAKELDSELKLTQSGVTYGTPNYMSPEQVRGEQLTGQTDIYSLGGTLYHMLTGSPPFFGRNDQEVMEKHLYENIVPPSKYNPMISSFAEKLVLKMLQKSLHRRYKSPDALIEDIQAIIHGQSPPNLGFLTSIRKWIKSKGDAQRK